jgi:aspartyl-tRNA(Asn)/glutamyl-tRNA(Gln) amidotransferase subunit A
VTNPGKSDPCAMNVHELGRLYRTKKLSPVDVTTAILCRVRRLNSELRAYISLCEDQALAAAQAADLQIAAGIDLGPLHGVPFAVKDILRARGTRTTAASRVLVGAPLDEEDAPVVRRLRAAGAVLIGKLNLHEFARGDPDPDGGFGDVQNPRRIGHQAGSSSSGSAAAVAAGLCTIALGTDTGGSIRHPASVCGVVGLKPTYGRVPLRGVIPLSPSLDHVGPLGRSVADVAAAMTVIAGHDEADPTSLLAPVPNYMASLEEEVTGLRLGLPTNAFYRFGMPDAVAILEHARQTLTGLGLIPIPIELPMGEETNELSRLIIDVELWSYHLQFRAQERLYGKDFLERSKPGLETPAVSYARAKAAQSEIRRHWIRLFDRVDLLALPANCAGAPLHGVQTIDVGGETFPVPMVCSRFNRASNLTGFPALVLPCGATANGLPIAIQFVGPPLSEGRLLATAYVLEQCLGDLVSQWGIEPRKFT